MFRESLVVCALVALPGCSLILDFGNDAIPKDAAIDAPYTADECAYGEPNDTFATAYRITPGVDTGPAAICPTTSGSDDLDHYVFTVPAGTSIVTVRIDLDEKYGDLDLKLLDSTQVTVSSSHNFTGGETIACPGSAPPCTALAPGDYVMRVFPAVQGAVNAYTFSVQITP